METSYFKSFSEILKNAPREIGHCAFTGLATYCYDGHDWCITSTAQYIEFEVRSRQHITGRGYVTVIYNPDLIPIDTNSAAVVKGQFRIPIHSIERTYNATDPLTLKPEMAVITNEETLGDTIIIRMYPEKNDKPVHFEDEIIIDRFNVGR